jgi:predicted outer membrane repeat protein
MLMGSSNHTIPIVFENNIATVHGGVINSDENSTIATSSNGTFMFRNNIASYAGGVLYGSGSTMELTNCYFMNNMAGSGGGGIAVVGSNLHLRAWKDSNQSPFTIQGNHATGNGGFMEASNSIITIDQYHFKNNSAQYGGALFMWNTQLMLMGSSNHTIPIVFENNIATVNGGVINSNENSIIATSNGTFMFRNNMASYAGGVLYGSSSTMELTNCYFMNNVAGSGGGGIFVVGSNLHLRAWKDSNQSPFIIQDNHATVSGGFMDARDSIITIDHYHFKNNSARVGGVLFMWNTSLTLIGSSNHTIPIVFENNIATASGGVIFARNNSIIATTNGTILFQNNMAIDTGGVLYGSRTIIELTSCQFMNNLAGIGGGGIILFYSNLHLKALNDCHQPPSMIQSNRATGQGGFMTVYDSSVTIGQYHFKNNSAEHGGVFHILNTSLMLVGCNDRKVQVVFEYNIATAQGGVIFARNKSIITTSKGDFLFRNNRASHLGGAIAGNTCLIKMPNCHFISNKASIGGGAIMLQGSNVTLNNSENPNLPIEFRYNAAQVVCHSYVLML